MNQKDEKSLIKINENNFFYKIKLFLYNVFHSHSNESIEDIKIEYKQKENSKQHFMDSIKDIENKETQLLKLQKQYRNGEISERDLSKEQIDLLCALYDKQIYELRKSNAFLRSKLSQS